MTVAAPAAWPRLEDVVDPIRQIVDGTAQITCLAHNDADADSLGSALGFALALRSRGRNVRVVVPEPLPRLLEHLPGFESVETGGAPLGDTVFTFDCATLGRFGERRGEVERAGTVVNIDHHSSNTGFGTINLVVASASATGQVIHGLLRELGLPIGPAVATNLYAALFTDTGGFRHENTTEAALRLGASLVAAEPTPVGSPSRATSRALLPRCASRASPSRRCDPSSTGACSGPRSPRRCWSRPGPTCRTPKESSTGSRASPPWRSPSSSRNTQPTEARSACAPVTPSTRPRSARRSEVEAILVPPALSSATRLQSLSGRCSRWLAG